MHNMTIPLAHSLKCGKQKDIHPEYQHDDPEFDAWCDRVIEAVEGMKKAFK